MGTLKDYPDERNPTVDDAEGEETMVEADERIPIELFKVPVAQRVSLQDHPTEWLGTPSMQKLAVDKLKDRAAKYLDKKNEELAETQEILAADNRYGVLLIFQGMDAAGKDGTIKRVTQGVNPAGFHVVSFKQPSRTDLDHTFLWRYTKELPEHGLIGIFNRSYYEEVCVVRVHPELIAQRSMPYREIDETFWQERFDDMNNLEKHLVRNGTLVIKFFLHISRDAQKARLMKRLTDEEKHWKFSMDDLVARHHWDDYQRAFEDMLSNTSTPWAPWYVIPADHKWVMRALVAHIVNDQIRTLSLRYPPADVAKIKAMREAIAALENEAKA